MGDDISYLPVRIAVLAITLCLSAFFSGSETALFSFQPDELARMRDRGGVDGLIARLRQQPKRLLITILFGNMLVNVVFFSVSYTILLTVREAQAFSPTAKVLCSFSSVLAVLLFGEVAPKNIAVSFYHAFGRTVAYPLSVIQKILTPVIVPLERIAEFGAGLVGGDTAVRMHTDELQVLVDVSAREGVLDLDEGEMISDIIRISDVRISELMVPRVEMVSFQLTGDVDDLLSLFRDSKLTMIPVYDRTKDHMRGLVHVKDVLLMDPGQHLAELVRPVPFLPETATAEETLIHCRDQGSKTAFVVDEHGAVLGLVTLEDLLEEIVGEIDDEFDADTPPDVEDLGGGRYRVRGGMALRELEEEQDWEAPEMDVDTVGGLVMALLDRMPQEGDSVSCNGITLTVETINARRADLIIIESLSQEHLPGQGQTTGPGESG